MQRQATGRQLRGDRCAGQRWHGRGLPGAGRDSSSRDVAIKVLPRAVASDPHRVARFERESRILASLNHPNIAAIHSVSRRSAICVCLAPGTRRGTNARRPPADGPLLDEALDVARELASALEAAHEQRRHPSRPETRQRQADAVTGSSCSISAWQRNDPADRFARRRRSLRMGHRWLILGTCAYMSPEQARGKPADRRTDVWAFGCVLFEMLSGTRAFDGDTTSDTIAAVLEHEPDWSRLPAGTRAGHPARSCAGASRRIRDQRLHDIADARLEIEDALANRDDRAQNARVTRALRQVAIAVALGAAAIASAGGSLQRRPGDQPANRTTRFTWALPRRSRARFTSGGVSRRAARSRLLQDAKPVAPRACIVRPLDELVAQPVAGTEGAKQPFWSPDSGRSATSRAASS